MTYKPNGAWVKNLNEKVSNFNFQDRTKERRDSIRPWHGHRRGKSVCSRKGCIFLRQSGLIIGVSGGKNKTWGWLNFSGLLEAPGRFQDSLLKALWVV